MNPASAQDSQPLSRVTSGFVLAAVIAILFNTALAWAKDASAPLTDFMKSLTGHHWITHGLADLILFVGLGFLFANSKTAGKAKARQLTGALVAAVAIASAGLALWFALV
jgi:hypothetical protein